MLHHHDSPVPTGHVPRLHGDAWAAADDSLSRGAKASEPKRPAIDTTKPVYTRAGARARIVATDVAGPAPILALVPNSRGIEVPLTFFVDGRMSEHGMSTFDLVNAQVVYLNVYPHGVNATGALVESRAKADEQRAPSRIGVIRGEIVSGRIISVALDD
jgi:hypothetical protein